MQAQSENKHKNPKTHKNGKKKRKHAFRIENLMQAQR